MPIIAYRSYVIARQFFPQRFHLPQMAIAALIGLGIDVCMYLFIAMQ